MGRPAVRPDLFRVGIVRWERHETIGIEAMNQTWVMISCSPVSGQMAFRFTEDWRITQPGVDQLQNYLKDHFVYANLVGLQRDTGFTISHQELLGKVGEASALLGWKLKDPFVTADEGWPVVADQHKAVKLVWPQVNGDRAVAFHLLKSHKLYRSAFDPIVLGPTGMLMVPLTEIMKRLEDEATLFLDPLATHDTGRKNHNETRTLRGLRQLRTRATP
jgi:hypothetical protein